MPRSVNPATGIAIEEFNYHSADEIDRILTSSERAFEGWRSTAFKERADFLVRIADLLEERRDTLARFATLEMGKRLAEARSEVEKCAWVCRYYAENGERFLSDNRRESDAGTARVAYEPLGLILAVMPWNFPYWQVFRFAAPNIMAGNIGLLKHASNVSRCAVEIERLFAEAGGSTVFRTILADSDQVRKVLQDRRVRGATLTGSEPAGSAVAAVAGKQIKPSVLELGGSDPFIVMPSADIEKAIETAVKARTINNGQSCIAAKRFIVHRDIEDAFMSGFVSRMGSLTLGDPMDDKTELGPLATEDIRSELHGQVMETSRAGAKCLVGAETVGDEGFFYRPTVLAEIPEDSPAFRDELFGPVAICITVDDADDAIRTANATRFGLGSSVWTHDDAEQQKFVRNIEAGSVFVNAMVASDPGLPFGGIKSSGYGRELSVEGIRAFVNIKTIVVN